MSATVPNPRPPVLLGCAAVFTLLFVIVVAAGWFIVFLESGSDTGRVTIDPLEAYPPGFVKRFPEDGFYIVRLLDGSTLALSDLDAANRASAGRRCRAEQINRADPALAAIVEEYERRFSPGAAGMAVVLREACQGALYDAAGVRLDADGDNLDRFEVDLDDEGRVVVNIALRECTRRTADDVATPIACP